MGKLIDLAGVRIGSWTVRERDYQRSNTSKIAYWMCICDCGTSKSVASNNLIRGKSTSCGCHRRHSIQPGAVFGALSITHTPETRIGAHVAYECRCLCGMLVTVTAARLLSGAVVSCGCAKVSRAKALGIQSRLAPGQAAANHLYERYRRNARSRRISFALPKHTFLSLVSLECAYCGRPPAQVVRAARYHGSFIYNGVDRLDSNVGYVEGNVVPCCSQCNYAKRDASVGAFIAWVERVYNHYIEGKNES